MPRHHLSDHAKRSAVKAITYRALVLVMDFTAVYLLTGKTQTAIGFMIASNIYTTLAYYGHERLWARIRWGTPTAPAHA